LLGATPIPRLLIHPVVRSFPIMGDALYSTLKQDMRNRGQWLPIVLYEGMIWDARVRYTACAELGMKPWLVPLRREDPVPHYIKANYERCGEPRSAERDAVVDTLMAAGSPEGRAEASARRKAWLQNARAEFRDFIRERPQPCVICGYDPEVTHAHHSFPLALQFECGIEDAIHDYQWLCPKHHKRVHTLLSGSLLETRDLSFLDCIPDHHAKEWVAIEGCAQVGIDLCCEALGRTRGETVRGRYDPPYSWFMLRNYAAMYPAENWRRLAA
jgi:hypothetical protein